jgi:hypothetical protein
MLQLICRMSRASQLMSLIAPVGLVAVPGCGESGPLDPQPTGGPRPALASAPASNLWVTRASMPTARRGLAVAGLDGALYAIGGESTSAAGGRR